MSKYTPGMAYIENGTLLIWVKDNPESCRNGKPLCTMEFHQGKDWYPSAEEAKANAERVVSCWNSCEGIADPSVVPELLEALKELVARCDGEEGVQPDGSNMCTLRAHAAIKKAEGRHE